MITRRFATARELALAAALALTVFGPSLALAQDVSQPAEADGYGLSRSVSGRGSQPTDPGLDEMTRLPWRTGSVYSARRNASRSRFSALLRLMVNRVL